MAHPIWTALFFLSTATSASLQDACSTFANSGACEAGLASSVAALDGSDTDPAVSLLQHSSAVVFSGNTSQDGAGNVNGDKTKKSPWDIPELMRHVNDVFHGQHKCGVLWFYHVPHTGGKAFQQWLWNMRSGPKTFEAVYNISMANEGDGSDSLHLLESFHDMIIKPFLMHPKDRLIAVHQDQGPGLLRSKKYLSKLKDNLKGRDCDLWRVTFLRNPEHMLYPKIKSRTTVEVALLQKRKQSPVVPLESSNGKVPNSHADIAEAASQGITRSFVQRNMSDWSIRTLDGAQAKREADLHTANTIDDTLDKLISEAVFKDPAFDNPQLRFLLDNKKDSEYPIAIGAVNSSAFKVASKLLHDFEYVGLAEEMDQGIKHIADMLNLAGTVPLEQPYGVPDAADMALPTDIQKAVKPGLEYDRRLYLVAATIGATTTH